jgi:hypothetical protein
MRLLVFVVEINFSVELRCFGINRWKTAAVTFNIELPLYYFPRNGPEGIAMRRKHESQRPQDPQAAYYAALRTFVTPAAPTMDCFAGPMTRGNSNRKSHPAK